VHAGNARLLRLTNNAVFALPAAGQVIRITRSHGLPHPPDDLPLWNPVGDALTRLDDAEALPPVDREALLGWCSDLAPRITALNTRINLGLVHGDAHTGNLLRRPPRPRHAPIPASTRPREPAATKWAASPKPPRRCATGPTRQP
jgi:hypothetical protein